MWRIMRPVDLVEVRWLVTDASLLGGTVLIAERKGNGACEFYAVES